jgi:fatty acid-binding protein DegV
VRRSQQPTQENNSSTHCEYRKPQIVSQYITPLGPVLALHVGAGAVAVCLELPEA